MIDLLANERFLSFLEAVGTPVLVLFVLMICVWRAASWIGNQIVKPLASHQIAFLEAVSELAQRNSETLVALKQSVEKLERAIETLIGTRNGKRVADD